MTVTQRTAVIRPRDPLIARTARPFNAEPGALAETLPWPLPMTTAGAVRSHLASIAPSFTDWADPEMTRQAKQTSVCGPLLLVRLTPDAAWTAYLPAPADALAPDDADTGVNAEVWVVGARPVDETWWQAAQEKGMGCNLPVAKLVPVLAPGTIKGRPVQGFWSLTDTIDWLASATGDHLLASTVPQLPIDIRTHVAIDNARQTNVDGLLFSTSGLVFHDAPRLGSTFAGRDTDAAPALAIGCRVKSAARDWVKTPAVIPLGGERRQATIEFPERAHDPWPRLAPDHELGLAIAATTRLRLQLVTPAVFRQPSVDHGETPPPSDLAWLPGWIDAETLTGLPDGLADLAPLRFRLIAAALGRRQAVSGWSMRRGKGRATRYAVPAGSVYFFALEGGSLAAAAVKRLWLRSIADDPQDRQDGFGLVLPGIWQPTDETAR
ncbi:MAG: type III-B CRISPR module-associated protein Cmr3 [Chloroflexota bacterium]|nr:type III-B CRISPR module-associated protein Cmr3 [Chloroflexota bacterium]